MFTVIREVQLLLPLIDLIEEIRCRIGYTKSQAPAHQPDEAGLLILAPKEKSLSP